MFNLLRVSILYIYCIILHNYIIIHYCERRGCEKSRRVEVQDKDGGSQIVEKVEGVEEDYLITISEIIVMKYETFNVKRKRYTNNINCKPI